MPLAALAQDDPEATYLKLHRATLSQNLNEMMLYASDEQRGDLAARAGDPATLKLISSMMPRVYTVRALALSPDGTRARMRATGTFTFMGSTAPSFGVVDLVKQRGEWKVDKFEWSGDKPVGFDAAVAQNPVRRSSAETKVDPAPSPAPPPPPVEKTAPAVAESPPPGGIVRSANRQPCVIKPVMTDDDLEACGATPR